MRNHKQFCVNLQKEVKQKKKMEVFKMEKEKIPEEIRNSIAKREEKKRRSKYTAKKQEKER